MALEAQDNPFPYVTLVETADPSTPAAGTKRVWLDTDGVIKEIDDADVVTPVGGAAGSVATDAIFDAKGDLAVGTGADTADNLTVGADDTVLMADSGQTTGLKWVASQTPSTQAFGDAAAEGTADTYARGDHKHAMPADPGSSYAPPLLTNQANAYNASTTSLVVTMTAPTAGDNLVCLVYSTGRGANSVTQTNVVWTQRYTGNGGSQWFEVWTGVVSASAGTTATVALTGANKVQAESFVVSGVTPFTAASLVGSSATATAALSTISTGAFAAAGDYIICGTSANSPTSSYSGLSQAYSGTGLVFGGAGSMMMFRAGSNKFAAAWRLSSGSVAYFMAFVKVS